MRAGKLGQAAGDGIVVQTVGQVCPPDSSFPLGSFIVWKDTVQKRYHHGTGAIDLDHVHQYRSSRISN